MQFDNIAITCYSCLCLHLGVWACFCCLYIAMIRSCTTKTMLDNISEGMLEYHWHGGTVTSGLLFAYVPCSVPTSSDHCFTISFLKEHTMSSWCLSHQLLQYYLTCDLRTLLLKTNWRLLLLWVTLSRSLAWYYCRICKIYLNTLFQRYFLFGVFACPVIFFWLVFDLDLCFYRFLICPIHKHNFLRVIHVFLFCSCFHSHILPWFYSLFIRCFLLGSRLLLDFEVQQRWQMSQGFVWPVYCMLYVA